MEELASLDVAFTPQENDFLSFDEGELPKMRAKIPKAGNVISNSCVAHETVATGEGTSSFVSQVNKKAENVPIKACTVLFPVSVADLKIS